jgi:hypothetical protein
VGGESVFYQSRRQAHHRFDVRYSLPDCPTKTPILLELIWLGFLPCESTDSALLLGDHGHHFRFAQMVAAFFLTMASRK